MKLGELILEYITKGDNKLLKETDKLQNKIAKQSQKNSKIQDNNDKKQNKANKIKNADAKQSIKSLIMQNKQIVPFVKHIESLGSAITGATSLAGAFIGVTGAIVGASLAIEAMNTKIAQSKQYLSNFKLTTGLDPQWVIKGANVMRGYDTTFTGEEMAQNLQALQQNLTAIKFGQGNVAGFQMLGINPLGKDATQILREVLDKIRPLAPDMRTMVLGQLGLDARLSALADMPNTLIDQREKLSKLTELDQAELDEAKRQAVYFTDLKNTWTTEIQRLSINIGKILQPILTILDFLSISVIVAFQVITKWIENLVNTIKDWLHLNNEESQDNKSFMERVAEASNILKTMSKNLSDGQGIFEATQNAQNDVLKGVQQGVDNIVNNTSYTNNNNMNNSININANSLTSGEEISKHVQNGLQKSLVYLAGAY